MKEKVKSYLPVCPYCGRPVSFFEAWFLHTQGEYTCEKCGLSSNIRYHSQIYITAALASFVSTMLVFAQSILKTQGSVIDILAVALPFLLFYAAIPFMMNLEKIPEKRRNEPIQQNTNTATAAGSTILMPAVRAKRPVNADFDRNGNTIVMPAVKDAPDTVKVYQPKGKEMQKSEDIQDILREFIDRYGEDERE